MFPLIDSVGLARLLLSEADKTCSAAAVVVMPRPVDEDPFDTGRQFYRLWLDFERLGFKACPMSVLSDLDEARHQLEAQFGVDRDRQVRAVIRIGVRAEESNYPRARLPAERLIA